MELKKGKFLTAEWRKLIIANYPIDPEILLPFVPKGTELDYFQNTCYVSLVGFMFLNTKILGLTIPFHKNFEEFNLRFYVKRKTETGWKRGVVFIKEIVPKPAVALVAKSIYREPYEFMPMKHEIIQTDNNLTVGYYFQYNNLWNKITVQAEPKSIKFDENSEANFITEHFWGYNKYSNSITMEYEVEHPTWEIYPIKDFNIQLNIEAIYGKAFTSTLKSRPLSIILAEGSEVCVRKGSKILF